MRMHGKTHADQGQDFTDEHVLHFQTHGFTARKNYSTVQLDYALLERTNCTTYGEANTRRDGSGAMARYTFGG